ncbi:ankyrin repeat and EF-hand domain-containing protein 1 isoform X3 [Catharus ustulatus]|uniref:ankyrin repeat and EF-hand domain-containing protein 1 isoform X3 n=1 Tax=Catharus ustulatus TaxID=91951 RepID=UPI00140E1C24|nr:ankyrin repeat and EF-hand domain-containing protein 1 isoform X3 [Catharus ustulatus]
MAAAEAGGDPTAAPEPATSTCSSESTSLKEDNLSYPGMLPVDKRLLNLQIYKLLQCVHEKNKEQIENLIQKGFPDLINYTEPKEGYGAFHLASMKNDIEMCSFLLEHGARPNVHDKMGRTPAMKAAELGHEVILELLVKANADMTAVDNEGKGILFYCLSPTARHTHCLQIALEYGADVNNCTTTGRSVLLEACEQAHRLKEMCLIFLEKGADPNAKDPATGRTAVMEAAREGTAEVVLDLLRRGADVNLFDFERHSAAHFAAKGGFLEHEDAIRKELETEEEGDGMVSRNDFMSLIRKHWGTVDEEQIEILAKMHEESSGKVRLDDFFKGSKYLQKIFLLSSFGPKAKKKKKPQRKKGKKGLPVPICVIPKSELPLREDGLPTYMVEAVPRIPEEQHFKQDHQATHPMLDDRVWYVEEPRKTLMDINYLVKKRDFVSLQKAFDAGVPVDIKDKYYKTPLMVACASGNIVLVEFLLEKGADVNATDNFLWTPLHHACYNGHLDITELLVKAGAAVNAPAIGNATPLMRAIEACRLDMVYFLITAGADVQATNSNGKSVLDLAQIFQNATIIELLENQLQILAEEQEKEEAMAAKGGKPKPAEPPKPVKEPEDVSEPPDENPVPEKPKRSRKDSSAYLKSLTKRENENDISFRPRKIWSPDATAIQLAERQELIREHAALYGHMEDFTTLFNRKFNK